MYFESKFNIGDKVWIPLNNIPYQVTVGKITIEHTDSQGIKAEQEQIFDNYKPQKSHIEQYMCDETGIGSGSVWTLGKSIFATKDECWQAITNNLIKHAQ